MSINNNRSATNTPNVTLVLAWAHGSSGSDVVRMRFSNDGATWSAWEPLAATRPYTLPGADGHKTVRVQYLDKANNRSLTYSDYIRLDTTPPTGSIVINGGAATTFSPSVTLGLTSDDGAGSQVSRMRFSDDGAHWTAWEMPAAARAYTLPDGLGYHTVRVQYLDGAGNYSAVYNDYIKLVEPYLGATETVMLRGDVPLVMVWIPGGTFMMGRYSGEQDSINDEDPQHSVTLSGYWMGKYELTKRQWTAVMYTAPWTGGANVLPDPDSPAVYVSLEDAVRFCWNLNYIYIGKTFRLPSEAEWEYACRAGTSTRFYWGDDPDYTAIGDYAWYDNTSPAGQYAHVVGQKLPNAWGLYDMSGNVWERCEDWYHDSYTGAPTDGNAWETPTGSFIVVRGGSWYDYGYGYRCRSAHRANTFYPSATYGHIGFRVAR